MLWSDAWILLATIYAARGKPALLKDVIAAADYIQHAIVTFEEMEGALFRLSGNGHLDYSNGELAPNEKTMAFYQSITRPERKVLDEQRDIEQYIGASGWSAGEKPQDANNGVSFPVLTRTIFESAVKAYLGTSKK